MRAISSDILERIVDAQPPHGMSTKIIAIDGFGGAGKSTFAGAIVEAIGGTIVHTDDFASQDTPIDWWPRLVQQVLEPLRRNEPSVYQRYDWARQTLAEWIDLDPGGLVIIEGVSSSRIEFRPFLALSIWIETPAQERLRRGLERDGQDALGDWNSWMVAEDAWARLQQPRENADLVVPGIDVWDDGILGPVE